MMETAILENSVAQLASRRVLWDEKERVFKIPGKYVSSSPDGRVTATGTGVKVDLDLAVTPL